MMPRAKQQAKSVSSPWPPLRVTIFRNLLVADLVSDIGAFMQSVGAAWLMTSLTTSVTYVALIQTAAALPFFLLALPAGAIGDIFDRRKLILGTEMWMAAVAILLADFGLSNKAVTMLAHSASIGSWHTGLPARLYQ
ncbi:MAG: MFS transporter [Candidatus Acidiferrales bacterium]